MAITRITKEILEKDVQRNYETDTFTIHVSKDSVWISLRKSLSSSMIMDREEAEALIKDLGLALTTYDNSKS